jgi:hypothetical protein
MGMVSALSNIIEAACFIYSTALFLYQIALKLGMDKRDLLEQVMLKHDGIGYIFLVLIKLYVVVGATALLVLRQQTAFTRPVSTAVVLSHTFAFYLFTRSSFNSAKVIIQDNSVLNSQPKIITVEPDRLQSLE